MTDLNDHSRQFDPAFVLIRLPDVEKITGLASTTIYRRIKDDPFFPKPVPLGDSDSRGSPVGFVLAEVQSWVRLRVSLR
ncbi:helix-turn-helix transcriptional regulator [Pseudomonas fluorescens]|uniref:helix-turn-helix transcriptional regulator n=1 Tax=Pseudomonas fluorescens TaxID=294 RepID=UPI000AFC87C8|nr:AlpA family phage regulatory protein [Pseudomonas fluorescens]